ncbi:MAG TPA: ATP-binding cassette domain-containing protein, partial [Rhizomicrobium sp.]
FYAELYGANGGIDLALEEVGLIRARDLPCQYLSAGQKKRLSLARLKLSARPLWLLDEPLAALDSAGKSLAAQFIASHCASGGIAIVATHEALGIEATRLALA